MPLTIDLGRDELATMRFGVSPLGETVSGLQLLGHGSRTPHLSRWLRWARAELRRSRLTLPAAWALVMGTDVSFPEFLTPSPARVEPTVGDELERMRHTRAAQVRASIARVFGADPPPAARQLLTSPAATLRAIAGELLAAHDLLLAPHWSRMQAVLLADIAHRARQVAIGGPEKLFADLHPSLSWRSGRIEIAGSHRKRPVSGIERGLVLVPSVLTEDIVRVKLSTSTQTVLRYPARGAGELWQEGLTAAPAAVVQLLGAARARVLAATRVPTSTGAIAAALSVTPSAVSQQLAVLRASGLVRSERSGRTVLHLATDLGRSLLDPG